MPDLPTVNGSDLDRLFREAVSAVDAGDVTLYPHATALHQAVCSGSLEAVRVLVEAGAELSTRDTVWNGTPLGWAEYYQREHRRDETGKRYAEIADYLRARGDGAARS